jgi:hypothetical protein
LLLESIPTAELPKLRNKYVKYFKSIMMEFVNKKRIKAKEKALHNMEKTNRLVKGVYDHRKVNTKMLFQDMMVDEVKHTFHPTSKLLLKDKKKVNPDGKVELLTTAELEEEMRKRLEVKKYKLNFSSPDFLRKQENFQSFISGGPVRPRDSLIRVR